MPPAVATRPSSCVCSIYYISTSSLLHPSPTENWAECLRLCLLLSGSFHAQILFFQNLFDMRCPARALSFFYTHYLVFSCNLVHNWMSHEHWAERILQSFREIQLFHVYVCKRHARNRIQPHWLCTEAEHLLHSSSSDTRDTGLPFSAFIPSRE